MVLMNATLGVNGSGEFNAGNQGFDGCNVCSECNTNSDGFMGNAMLVTMAPSGGFDNGVESYGGCNAGDDGSGGSLIYRFQERHQEMFKIFQLHSFLKSNN